MAAQAAVKELQAQGIQAQMAKVCVGFGLGGGLISDPV